QEQDVESALVEAKREGMVVIVGDSITVRLAKLKGMQGILITSGKEAVINAFEVAKQLYLSVTPHKERSLMLEQLTDDLDYGVAVINMDGQLTYANQAFYELLEIDVNEKNRELSNRLPRLKGI